MAGPAAGPMVVQTSAGDFPLRECRLAVGGREWTVLHTGAVLTVADEASYFADLAGRLPYGVVLWPAAIALAHEIATRADAFRGRQEGALAVCKLNGERNRVASVEYRDADWAAWDDAERYDWILGSDILYG